MRERVVGAMTCPRVPMARGVRSVRAWSPRTLRLASALLLAAVVVPSTGCTREFFREWANQDVSESVFEKSRDPRWRLEWFSIEPPMLARYASPYDPDTPPAPPDDYAAQSLSPVPQWPDNRLMVPAEGTGYLDMMEAWKRDQPAPAAEPAAPASAPAPASPPPAGQPPFGPGTGSSAPSANSGPGGRGMTPIHVAGRAGAPAAQGGRAAGTATRLPQPPVNQPRPDVGVRLAAFQETNIPLPVPRAAQGDQGAQNQPPPSPEAARPDQLPSPAFPLDPDPGEVQNLGAPTNPRPDQTPGEYQAAQGVGAEMAGSLIPAAINFDEAEAAGLPPGKEAYKLNPEQSLKLALINSRAYQFQLEQVYLSSLSVTLQRFAFEPQFVAGLSPVTATAAGLPASLPTSFLYRTKEAPGGQASTLSLGTVAGFGKVFVSGARLLGGFANQVVFNFTGKTPRQPSVQSFLPLAIVQPFLRGGGRAVTLEALTTAERQLLYQIRLFARFRQEFFTSVLAATSNISQNSGLNDPTVGYLYVVQQLQEVENDRMNVATFEQLLKVFRELVKGEASGLTQLQVDQVDQNLYQARAQLLSDLIQYRNALDQFKVQIGIPPDVPLTLDLDVLNGFRQTYKKINLWAANPKRELEDLDRIVAELPKLEDVVVDGRSVLEIAGIDPSEDPRKEQLLAAKTENLEDLLLAAERVALENRLDLMNVRAQLYDSWRQIRFTANALQGVLNVQITNQIFTPTTTTNPFAFVDQAKQFQLVLNAELPLVRLAERNAFRQALINYERQRRTLMNAEDVLKLSLRTEIRNLQLQAQQYEIQKRSFVLNLRQKDQSQEQLIAPPSGGGGGVAQSGQAAIQTQNLIGAQQRVLQTQNILLQTWINYETQRIIVYRDLGIMPYDEWEAYYELFPTSAGRGDDAAATAVARPAPVAAANPAQGVGP